MSKINGNKVTKVNELHDIVDWNVDNLVFADPDPGSVPFSDPPINFIRVNLLTKNHKFDEDGNIEIDENGQTINDDTMGDLTLSLDRMFSFGVSETTSQETKAVTGHSMSFALWSREGATEREICTSRKLEAIISKCKDHIITIKKDLKKPKMVRTDLKDMDKMLYWKEDENGERVAGQGPTFSPKLIEYKARTDFKTGKEKPYQMCTIFYLEDEVDESGEPVEVDPLDFLSTKTDKRYCHVRPAVKIESIFFGAKVISIQCKLAEADVAAVKVGPQRLLHGRHKVKVHKEVTINKSKNVNPLLSHEEEKEEQTTECLNEEDELNDLIEDTKTTTTTKKAKLAKKKKPLE
jgi:hypothetical protein